MSASMVSGKTEIESTWGAHTIITADEEKRLADGAVDIPLIKYGRRKEHLMAV